MHLTRTENPQQLANLVGISPTTLTRKLAGDDRSRLSFKIRNLIERAYGQDRMFINIPVVARSQFDGWLTMKRTGKELPAYQTIPHQITNDDTATYIAVMVPAAAPNGRFASEYMAVLRLDDIELVHKKTYQLELTPSAAKARLKGRDTLLVSRTWDAERSLWIAKWDETLEPYMPHEVREVVGRIVHYIVPD